MKDKENNRNSNSKNSSTLIRQPKPAQAQLKIVEADTKPEELPELNPHTARLKREAMIEEVVEELNKQYALVRLAGSAQFLYEIPENNDYNFTDEKSAKLWELDNKILLPIVDERNNKIKWKEHNKFDLWLNSPNRRKFAKVVFDPSKNPNPAHYNLWKGFAIEPLFDEGAGCQLIRKHIFENLCEKNKEYELWFLSWLAQCVQCPDDKPGTAIILKGRQGTGKGIIASQVMQKIFGRSFVQLTQSKQVTGNFNAVWEGKMFAFCDESFWAGSKEAEGPLKGLITEKNLMIEHKGKNAYPIDSFTRIIMASNNDWVVPADFDSRRYFVLKTNSKIANNDEYFKALKSEIDADGARSFFGFLLNFDYSKVNLRFAPTTTELRKQKLLSMDSVGKFWYTALRDGYIRLQDGSKFILSDIVSDNFKQTKIETKQLYLAYIDYCKQMSIHYKCEDSVFGAKIAELALMKKERIQQMNERTNFYIFLESATDSCLSLQRAKFEKILRSAVNWENDEDEEDGDNCSDFNSEIASVKNHNPHLRTWEDDIPF